MLDTLADWLASTALSTTLQTVSWAIPDLQSLHIIALAFLMGSAWVLDLRLLGFKERSQPIAAVGHRFLPWVWWPLGVLIVTGALLVTAEPNELLGNDVFQLKMLLLAAAIVVTLVIQAMMRKPAPSEAAGTTAPMPASPALKGLAAVSILLWVAIAFAGRMIAYVG